MVVVREGAMGRKEEFIYLFIAMNRLELVDSKLCGFITDKIK